MNPKGVLTREFSLMLAFSLRNFQPGSKTHSGAVNCVPGSLSEGVKWSGPVADYLPQSSAVVKMHGAVSRILPAPLWLARRQFHLYRFL